MITLFHQGGLMMWPLLALSVLGLAVVCERAMFYASLGFPSADQKAALNAALASRDAAALDAALPSAHPVFGPYFEELRKFSRPENRAGRMQEANPAQTREVLNILAQEIVAGLDNRLQLLGVIVRIAPLMGLLGTVTGMINTFSRLTEAQGGVDLMMLADGIWQALLTTAAGLMIAIPVLLVQYGFLSRKRRIIGALDRFSNAVFALGAEKGAEDHAA